ncbi:unnamed protein product [Rotaria socialis]|uniref:NAD(P)(+)--arginine ADP-ribosyltransferase n=1 Tax=Rotaria socialis TaxID=392032 RepID=A0A817RID9_9BILA|nr:unnamed protein product [Rotaria socialis]CAF4412618.1 unnamed protein product [Rotaria socialis]
MTTKIKSRLARSHVHTVNIQRLHNKQRRMKDPFSRTQSDSIIYDVPIRCLVPNRESITLVWFDPMLSEATFDVSTIARLHQLNDYILFYTQAYKCVEYFTSSIKKNERIIVILHGYELFENAYECEQVYSILIVDSSRNQLSLAENYQSKIVEIFQDDNSMINKLQQTITHLEHQAIQQTENIFITLDRKQRSLRDLRQELAPFLWCQVMIKAMPHSNDALEQMLDECRSYYKGNPTQLKIINEFKNTYLSTDAIYWYSRPCFLFRMINKALCSEDIVSLYKFRYFISDLSKNLEMLQNYDKMSTHVYRGTCLHRDEVEKYCVGHLVAANGFLSSSSSQHIAEIFCGIDCNTGMSPSRARDDEQQYVLFEIIISQDHPSNIVLADISTHSAFSNENEILFDMGATFEIVSVVYDNERFLWHIQMRTSAEIAQLYREYEYYVYDRIKETNASVLFGILLTDMGEYTKAYNYFISLLAQMPRGHDDRHNVFYSLSRVYRFKGKNRLALKFLRRAERLQRVKLPQSKFDLARTLAGIGSVYYELHDYRRELLYYKRAMIIYQNILPHDHIEIARSFNRLGFAYFNQQRYTQALVYLTKSIDLYKKIVPNGYPSIGQTLCNIGLVHHALGHVNETLDFYLQALTELEKMLPKDHVHIGLACYQLGVYYDEQQQPTVALQYAEKALKIRKKRLPSGHKLIREAKDLIKRIHTP